MKFTNFFSKKIEKNASFDFLNKFELNKQLFRELEISHDYFFPAILHKFPILPISHEKRIEIRDVCTRTGSDDIM
jgi:hypothetical protein